MLENATFILSAPWIGTVLGIVGVVLAIIFHFRGKINPDLTCRIDEFTVVGGTQPEFHKEISIVFAGINVERVTSTRLILWNSGNTTFTSDQLVQSDPLRVEISEGVILKAQILKTVRLVNQITIESCPGIDNTSLLRFDFLDRNDGCVIQITHTGPKNAVKLVGTLRGLPKGVIYWRPKGKDDILELVNDGFLAKLNQSLKSSFGLGIFLLVVGIFANYLSMSINYFFSSFPVTHSVFWPFVGVGLIYICLSIVFRWIQRQKYPLALSEAEPRMAKS